MCALRCAKPKPKTARLPVQINIDQTLDPCARCAAPNLNLRPLVSRKNVSHAPNLRQHTCVVPKFDPGILTLILNRGPRVNNMHTRDRRLRNRARLHPPSWSIPLNFSSRTNEKVGVFRRMFAFSSCGVQYVTRICSYLCCLSCLLFVLLALACVLYYSVILFYA